MKKLLIAVFISTIIFSSIFTGCGNGTATTTSTLTSTSTSISTTPTTTGTTTPEDGFTAAWCKKTVNSFKTLQPAVVPDNLADTGAKMGGEFDVNEYFKLLTHISMDSGYVLDYVYITDTKNGGPILYVRPADKIPFYTYDEYKTATHETPRQEKDLSLIWLVQGTDDTKWGNKIKIDGTSQGYFEYAVLQTLSNEFYLLGGATTINKTIFCEKADLESIWAEIEAAGMGPVDASIKEQAQVIDFTPVVTFHPGLVQVSFVFFHKYTGFESYSCYISKEYPYFITNVIETPLLDFNLTGQ